MKIGDEVFVHGYVDEMRKDVVIIRNDGGYFGTDPCEVEVKTDNPQYSYGMLDAEKFGLQHKIQSMIWDFMGDKIADTPQTERIKTTDYCDICNHNGCENCTANNLDDYCVPSGYAPKDTPQTDCPYKEYPCDVCDEQTDCAWK